MRAATAMRATLVILTSTCLTARAENAERVGPIALTFLGSALVTLGAIVPIVGNSVHLARRKRPARGWIVSGFVLGGLEVVGAAGFVAFGATARENLGSGGDSTAPLLGTGAALLAIAATSITLSALALRLPDGVSIRPLVLLDERRVPSPGIGVALAGW